MTRKTLLPLLALSAGLAHGQANNYPDGSTVADFTVTDTDGNTHNLYSYTSAGKHVMLEFFYYSCNPCQTNYHKFCELYETYGCNSADLICLLINTIGNSDNLVSAFGPNFSGGWEYPPAVGSGGSSELTSVMGVQAAPTIVLIAPDNTMVDNSVWPFGSSMQSLVNHFPPNSNIEPANCGLTVSVAGSEPSVEMTAFPSPTNGPLTVTFDLLSERRVQLQLVDALGREAAQWDLGHRTPGSFVETLDMSAQQNGTYLLRAFTDDGVSATWRVVVAR